MNRKLAHHRVLSAFLVLLGGFCCLRAQSPAPDEKPFPVSLIRVIANPEKFDGQRLRVIGVLAYGGGLDQAVCLCVSETDARNAVMPNCIDVDRSFEKGDKLLGQYVILTATFRYIGGHGLSFQHITDMKRWSSPAEK